MALDFSKVAKSTFFITYYLDCMKFNHDALLIILIRFQSYLLFYGDHKKFIKILQNLSWIANNFAKIPNKYRKAIFLFGIFWNRIPRNHTSCPLKLTTSMKSETFARKNLEGFKNSMGSFMFLLNSTGVYGFSLESYEIPHFCFQFHWIKTFHPNISVYISRKPNFLFGILLGFYGFLLESLLMRLAKFHWIPGNFQEIW